MDETALANLFVANDDFAELEQSLDGFCPFEAVGMVNQEIRHGHFLSYLFDPNRPHGFGTECLRALMAAATRAEGQLTSDLSLLAVHLMDFESAIIRREWRKIDILIEVPEQKLVVAIELKIDSAEHSGQLGRYRDIVTREWPKHRHLFLFLTKHGDEPSDADGEYWIPVLLEQLADELASVLAKHDGETRAKAMLSSYLAMLGRHHLNDDKLEELAVSLWNKHREALDFLADRRPNAMGELFARLTEIKDALASEIVALSGEEVVSDHSRPAAIRFAVPSWDKIPGFDGAVGFTPSNRLILIELVKAGPDYLRCYVQLGRGDQSMRTKLFRQLRDNGADVGKKAEPTKEWNRLASTRISLKGIEENADLDKLHGRVMAQVRDFCVKHVPAYTKALKPLMVDD